MSTTETEQRAPAEMTPEDVEAELRKYAGFDIISYVLPTEELGADWVVGVEGLGIVKLSQNQAIAFIMGANSALRRLAKAGRLI